MCYCSAGTVISHNSVAACAARWQIRKPSLDKGHLGKHGLTVKGDVLEAALRVWRDASNHKDFCANLRCHERVSREDFINFNKTIEATLERLVKLLDKDQFGGPSKEERPDPGQMWQGLALAAEVHRNVGYGRRATDLCDYKCHHWGEELKAIFGPPAEESVEESEHSGSSDSSSPESRPESPRVSPVSRPGTPPTDEMSRTRSSRWL